MKTQFKFTFIGAFIRNHDFIINKLVYEFVGLTYLEIDKVKENKLV